MHQLKDAGFAEKAILKALPHMTKAARSEELRGVFAVHLDNTEEQMKRLEQVFPMMGEMPEGIAMSLPMEELFRIANPRVVD